MKLFVWNKNVFNNYKSGMAIALAETAEDAREMLWNQLGRNQRDIDNGNNEWLSEPPDETVECLVLDNPYSVFIHGSQ